MKICGTAPGQRDHVVTLIGVKVDAYLVDMRHPALLEQGLGPNAVGADLGRVHADSVHGVGAAVIEGDKLLQGFMAPA